ncbi:2OG-Fe(II) oxygenase [Sphingomonas sp. So64.6b]|uniref:2OG-Fe(II) oxygenase n=1 Tax=Sphingomonas sp. So64.6b TaxID=2997354 RepID=UPI001602E874|nr:2OG-Fe(II) oxygenase [Sphingomonas sp. So64.6b]QNA82756.1 2OG-Fe(II) oxygenase [Sphingomonas sp. So64.6b]
MSDARKSAYPARAMPEAMPALPALVLSDALPKADAAALLTFAIASEAMFGDALTLSSHLELHAGRHRSARTLAQHEMHRDLMATIALRHGDALRARFGDRILTAPVEESELAASGDGDWFGPHRDDGAAPVAHRSFTVVVYLHRFPCRFAGGELTLHGFQDAARQRFGPVQTIAPRHNVATIFPSNTLHEILPVSLSTPCFADRRFALTSWI